MSSVKKSKKKSIEEDDGFQLFAAPSKKTKKSKTVKKSEDDKIVSLDTSKTKKSKKKVSSTKEIEWLKGEYDPFCDFAQLGVDKWMIEILQGVSITKPTEIQQKCLPAILTGRDVVGRAKTGSGKTAAFALPIIQKLSKDPYGIFALVLTPTRELAYQIEDQFKILGRPLNIDTCVVVGGLEMSKQAQEINNRPHIIIATPGRLSDLLMRGTLQFYGDYLKFLVLDEADRLFEPCFAPFINTILDFIPPAKERQTLLFSATITANMLESNLNCEKSGLPPLVNNPVYIQVNAAEDNTVATLDQSYLLLPQAVKELYLYHIVKSKIEADTDKMKSSMIIFTSKCTGAAFVSNLLTHLGIENTVLHSKVPQAKRLANLAKFRSAHVNVLVCTDVAARGLDIPSVQFVCNYDVPRVPEDYIHRVGRTARAGRGGSALTFVSQYDVELYKEIEASAINKSLEPYEISEEEVLVNLRSVTEAKKIVQVSMRDFSGGEGNQIKRKITGKAAE